MKKTIKKFSAYYIGGVFILSPLLFLFMYITYTEKIITPILITLTVISLYFIIKED